MATPKPKKKISIRELESKRPTTIQTDKKEITPPKRVGEMVTKQDKLNKERLNKEGEEYYEAKDRENDKKFMKGMGTAMGMIAAGGALTSVAPPLGGALSLAGGAKGFGSGVNYIRKMGKAMKEAKDITMATEKAKIKQKTQPLRRFK
jgi:hypothetical protein